MFVLKSTYNKVVAQLKVAEQLSEEDSITLYSLSALHDDVYDDNCRLQRRNRELADALAQLTNERRDSANISQEDLKRLISLCHPDKHGGKDMATEMTQKLIKLRQAK